MRAARIVRPDALYDASIPARTFEAAGQAILNPIDLDEVIDVNIANSTGDLKFTLIDRYGEFIANKSKDVNRVSRIKKINIKRSINRERITDRGICCICKKR